MVMGAVHLVASTKRGLLVRYVATIPPVGQSLLDTLLEQAQRKERIMINEILRSFE
jgi:hypothetical protein